MNHRVLGCNSRRGRTRRGVATLELAICLPLMVMVTFGSIEAANFIYLKQALTEATYECARIATTPGHTSEQAKLRFQEIIGTHAINGTELTISPPVNVQTPSGTVVTVAATAPARQNSSSPLLYFRNTTLVTQVVMVRL